MFKKLKIYTYKINNIKIKKYGHKNFHYLKKIKNIYFKKFMYMYI